MKINTKIVNAQVILFNETVKEQAGIEKNNMPNRATIRRSAITLILDFDCVRFSSRFFNLFPKDFRENNSKSICNLLSLQN